MKYRIVFSPFLAYCFSFLIVIPVYFLDWSYLFPKLTADLYLFFVITFSVSILGALFFKNLLSLEYARQNVGPKDSYIIFLIIGYIAEFIYSKSIPLIDILNKISFTDITSSFGIPSFHVLLVGLTVFFSVFYFHSFLSQKKIKYILYYVITILLTVLVVSRVTLTFIFIASVYVYLMAIDKNFVGKIGKIVIVVLIFFAVFGFIGNVRSNVDVNVNNVILSIGEAKPAFIESPVPNSYFWAYLYIASPLANLQLNVNTKEVPFTLNNFFKFIVDNFLWDAASKRIDDKYKIYAPTPALITPALNVGTVFTPPYTYLGFWGMYFMYAYLFLLTVLFLLTLNRKSKYFVTYLACFNTLIVLCIFNNMITFTALSIVFIFPLLEKLKHLFIKD